MALLILRTQKINNMDQQPQTGSELFRNCKDEVPSATTNNGHYTNGDDIDYSINNKDNSDHNDVIKMPLSKDTRPSNSTPAIRIHGGGDQNDYFGGSSPSSILGSTPPQSFRRRCNSKTGTEDGDHNESKVLVIYTGGTIGMIRNDENSEYLLQ